MSTESVIKSLRERHNFSQADLAKSLEVSRQAVSTWEKGSSKPTMQNWYKMADVFGVPVSVLLSEVVEEQNDFFMHSKPNVEYNVGLNAAFHRVKDVRSFCSFVNMFCNARSATPPSDALGVCRLNSFDADFNPTTAIVSVTDIYAIGSGDGFDTVVIILYNRHDEYIKIRLEAQNDDSVHSDFNLWNEHYSFVVQQSDVPAESHVMLSLTDDSTHL